MRVWPGKPFPLGATWDGLGVNFALFSEHAEKVELCLFDTLEDRSEKCRIVLPELRDQVWHAYLPDVRPGQLYAYRVYGPYAPRDGHRFNPHKIVVDPYAKAILRIPTTGESFFGYSRKNEFEFDTQDNAAYAPLTAVIDPAFTWGNDQPPGIPWHQTIIYEGHVKGLTMLHPDVAPELRGTFLGIASEPIISHLKSLGITAIELMPVHQKVDEFSLSKKGLTNYWGYATLGFFAPDIRYRCSPGWISHVREFKMMVRALHAAGIEVILDVVYNHTAEGDHHGPTLSFRGIDNKSYYRLNKNDAQLYVDFTGCGNTLNMLHPRVLQLIMDSLRYWVQDMHVDGFRFDLASALARELFEVDRLGAFFDVIHQDPVISQVKLIAEPWDLGEGGYQVGNFPVLWTEWNGNYRDAVRSFLRGDRNSLGEFATRLAGSSDLYQSDRSPCASINYVTCHDGFTLEDMVSYQQKHNEANLEDNKDGTNDNRSINCGIEGKTTDKTILATRDRLKRNYLTTLFISAGVPMVLSGDEFGRTQRGNNNAYCQDNDLSWCNWNFTNRDRQLLQFVTALISFRKSQAVLQRRKFFSGKPGSISTVKDITWYTPAGKEMTAEQWGKAEITSIGVSLFGDAIDEIDESGGQIRGDTLLVLFNSGPKPVSFMLPTHPIAARWAHLLDTSRNQFFPTPCFYSTATIFDLPAQSISLFRLEREV